MSLPIYHFDLCITPNVKTPPVLNLGQYDNSRTFIAHLKKENGDLFYLDNNATAILEGITSELEVFQILATIEEQGSAISFIPDNISTSTPGRIYVTLQIRNNNKKFAPLHMILNVQAAGVSEKQKINNQVFKDAVEEAFQDYISTHDSEGAVIPHVDVTGDCAVINITSNGCFYNNQPITGEGIQELVDQKSAVFAYYDDTMFMYSKPIEENNVSYQSFTRIEDGLLQQILVPFNNNLIQYRIQPINGLLSISGKNLVDSYNAADKSVGSRINVGCNGEKASLFYRFENEEQRAVQDDKTGYSTDYALTTFRINLAAPLLEGHKYVLSFNCKNVYDNVLNNQYFPKFIIYNNTPKWAIQDEDSDGYEENALVYDCNINEKVYRSNVDGNKSLLESPDSNWTLIADKSQQQEQQNYIELMAVSEPFSLYEGRVFVILTPKTTIENFIRFKEIRNSGDHSQFITSGSKIQIDIFDIQIEEGTLSSNYQPAALTTFEKTKEASDLIHTYIEQASSNGWSVAELENSFIDAAYLYTYKNLRFLTDEEKRSNYSNTDDIENLHISEQIYIPFPAPLRTTNLTGSTDLGGVSLCSVNGIGSLASVGAYFRVMSSHHMDGYVLPKVSLRLSLKEKIASIPKKCKIPYDSDKGEQIRDYARSYVQAQSAGRKFIYGSNITYIERKDNLRLSDGLINDSTGGARMECDAFAGLVLKGIPYNKSPYSPSCTLYGNYLKTGWVYKSYKRADPSDGWYRCTEPVTIVSELSPNPELVVKIVNLQNTNKYYIYCPDFDGSAIDSETGQNYSGTVSWSWKSHNYSSNGMDYYLPLPKSEWSLPNNSNSNITRLTGDEEGDNRTGYQILMDTSENWTNENEIPIWAKKIREKTEHDTFYKCFKRDTRYASDWAWLFWWITQNRTYTTYSWEVWEHRNGNNQILPANVSTQTIHDKEYPILPKYNSLSDLINEQYLYSNGDFVLVVDNEGTIEASDHTMCTLYNCSTSISTFAQNLIFSDINDAKPGDVVFFRKVDTSRWFHNISHIAIVTKSVQEDIEDGGPGYITIAEVTGKAESGGRVMQEINMRYRDYTIAYFARPYGWY